mmetsp:Transcript_111009/g.353724  ORF Transcript_111009/g.353724 Transcript_111009/m.353724 type:complete len:750 (-) Transcript_111009:221-2470(-)|eukprot:CAMPEP_0203865856 /NCGR_PEP_ID=MMETSP0359-20131031/15599_1 /ASSEMBLY_ACC=CAM_ASM_000338 /TAXON_ID=268821 /ORGANISM="Scrippsiella Hangoei, Strain SHTV-5" /LENGTH=749 /DNA_ID=CAMNT_0050783843 /DNA_START=54 /DNA_END=2303 /DNA_ORIENTATION=-
MAKGAKLGKTPSKSKVKHDVGKRKTKEGAANRGKKVGQGALRAGTAIKHSNASSKAGRTAPNGDTRVREKGVHFRSEGTIKRLDMYNKKPNKHKMKEQATGPARIQPDRRWFGNTRVIAQDKMQAFRETIAKGVADPFSVVLKSSKLPMSLLHETEGKASRMDLLSIQPYKDVFSKKKQQKRVKLGSYDLESLVESVDTRNEGYTPDKDPQLQMNLNTGFQLEGKEEGAVTEKHQSEGIFNKGTSKRIWGELWKVVDASDVICFILDARDPMGTRCRNLEKEIRKTKAHKHIVLVLNKVDLVPTWVSRRWIQVLMKDFPTLAMHASITNPFGKNALLNLLRQFSTLMKDKKHVTVGMIGYPNVGKSSVINTLKRKKVCKAAPVPGETRIWQYIALTKRLYLLDCPGIVPATASDFDSDCAKVLKGVVRAERIETPSNYMDEVLTRVKKEYLLQRYKLPSDTEWENGEGFLTILANKMGKLFKGGDPDLDTAARIVLYDWQRGRIPYFTPPPDSDEYLKSTSSSSTATPGAADDAKAEDGEKAEGAEGAEGAEKPVVAEAEASAEGGEGDGDEDGDDDEGSESEDEVPSKGVPSKAETLLTQKEGGGLEVSVQQQLGDMSCSLVYNAEDRRGESLPLKAPEEQGGEGQAAFAAKKLREKKAAFKAKAKAAKEKKKEDKKRTATAGGADGEDGKGKAGAPAAAAGSKKKKPRRGGGGGGAGSSGMGGRESQQHLARPGAVDWGAVVAEFGN